jgi:hypothetical protein
MQEEASRLFDIHTAFAETEYGHLLASRVRYEKYKPGDMSNEHWVKLLGADVNNLTHLSLTYGLTRSLITHLEQEQPQLLSKDEENILQTAALIHDWAESIVGDISFGDKTAADETEEQRQLSMNLQHFFNGESKEAEAYVDIAMAEVIFTPESKLGRIFNAIERAGYLRTALRASRHVVEGTAPECREGLEWLIADVLSNQPIKLMEYAAELQPIKNFLINQQAVISEAFELVSPYTFINYGSVRQAYKEAEFADQKTAWERWIQKSGDSTAIAG